MAKTKNSKAINRSPGSESSRSGKSKKSKAVKSKAAQVQPRNPKEAWTLEMALAELQKHGSEKTRAFNAKNGAGENQFGVKMGDIRGVANRIKANHELALALWKTKNIDAQLLATLLIKPDRLSAKELEGMVRSVTFMQVAEWLHSYVVKLHPEKESLRIKWMVLDIAGGGSKPAAKSLSGDAMAARAGWRLTAGRVAKSPEGLDLTSLLDRIESEMGAAPREVQWTMNECLATIGIHFEKHRQRALDIGEKLGVFRDYPCSKGCTSPFAPIWINEMVRRNA